MHFVLLHSICHFLHPAFEIRLVVLEMLGDPRTTPCPSPSETHLVSFRQKGRRHPLPAQCDTPLPALLLELTLSRCIKPPGRRCHGRQRARGHSVIAMFDHAVRRTSCGENSTRTSSTGFCTALHLRVQTKRTQHNTRRYHSSR